MLPCSRQLDFHYLRAGARPNTAIGLLRRRVAVCLCLFACVVVCLLFSCATLSASHASPSHPTSLHNTQRHTVFHHPTSTRLVRSSNTMHRLTNESGSKGLTNKQLLLIALGGAVGLFALTTTTTPLFSTPSAPSAGRSLRRRQLSHVGVSLRVTWP